MCSSRNPQTVRWPCNRHLVHSILVLHMVSSAEANSMQYVVILYIGGC